MKPRFAKTLRVFCAAAIAAAFWLRANVVDVALVGGYAAIAGGAALVYGPAGLIVGGVLSAATALVLGRSEDP